MASSALAISVSARVKSALAGGAKALRRRVSKYCCIITNTKRLHRTPARPAGPGAGRSTTPPWRFAEARTLTCPQQRADQRDAKCRAAIANATRRSGTQVREMRVAIESPPHQQQQDRRDAPGGRARHMPWRKTHRARWRRAARWWPPMRRRHGGSRPVPIPSAQRRRCWRFSSGDSSTRRSMASSPRICGKWASRPRSA